VAVRVTGRGSIFGGGVGLEFAFLFAALRRELHEELQVVEGCSVSMRAAVAEDSKAQRGGVKYFV
jgi:hypothetical protein